MKTTKLKTAVNSKFVFKQKDLSYQTFACIQCNITKSVSEFYKDLTYTKGFKNHCKSCMKISNKLYRDANNENEKARCKNYRIVNKESEKARSKIYRKTNKIKRSAYERNRRNTEPLYKLKDNISVSIRNSFKRISAKKTSKTKEILCCSIAEFKNHLESMFESWMTWDNHGKYNGSLNYGWDMDHITPISTAVTEEDVIKLNHYTNFQPLCSKINRDIKKNILF